MALFVSALAVMVRSDREAELSEKRGGLILKMILPDTSTMALQSESRPNDFQNWGAKDGSLSTANGLAAVGDLVGRRIERPNPVAFVADGDRHAVRSGARTVTTWLRATGIPDDFVGYYYFRQPLGRKAKEMGIHCRRC